MAGAESRAVEGGMERWWVCGSQGGAGWVPVESQCPWSNDCSPTLHNYQEWQWDHCCLPWFFLLQNTVDGKLSPQAVMSYVSDQNQTGLCYRLFRLKLPVIISYKCYWLTVNNSLSLCIFPECVYEIVCVWEAGCCWLLLLVMVDAWSSYIRTQGMSGTITTLHDQGPPPVTLWCMG